jgi:competence protein ComEC
VLPFLRQRRARAQSPPMPSPALQLRAPLLWLLLPLIAGLAAAQQWPAPSCGLWPFVAGAAFAGFTAIGAAWFDRAKLWTGSLFVSVGLSGFVLLHARYPGLHQWETRPPREITVTLEILQVFPVTPKARSLTGVAIVTAAGETDRELIGRRVYYSAIRRISVAPVRSGSYLVQGVVEPLSRDQSAGGFNDYLANLGIRHRLTRARLQKEVVPPDGFRRFCTAMQGRWVAILSHGLAAQPETLSLYLAMLLGEKAVLSPEQQNAFMRSGTFHIFSVSGLHVGVISMALQGLLRLLRLPRRPAVVVNLSVLWLYVQITGGSSPAVRAFQMIAFQLASRVFRLPGNALAALTASALTTLLLDPLQLFSTGFQMSYTVVAALIVMGRPLADHWLARWKPFALLPKTNWHWWHRTIEARGRGVIGAAAGCWTAFLASVPSGIGFFGLFSPGSLLANLVIIPLSSAAMMAGFLSLVCGLAGLLPLSALCNLVAAAIITVADRLLQHGGSLPGMFFAARFRADWLAPASLVAVTSVMIAGAAGRWSSRYGGYWPPFVMLVLLVIFGVKFG